MSRISVVVLAAVLSLAGCGGPHAAVSAAPTSAASSSAARSASSPSSSAAPGSSSASPATSIDLAGLDPSPGVRALVTDYNAHRIDAVQFTRLALTLIGYLGDPVPAAYDGDLSQGDLLLLSFASDSVGGTLTQEQQDRIQSDVDTYTHGG